MTSKEETIQRILMDRNMFGTLRRTPEEYLGEAYDAALSQSAAQIADLTTVVNIRTGESQRWSARWVDEKQAKEKAESEIQALRTALRKLSNDIQAILGIATLELVQHVGTTNVECLKRRLADAASLLNQSDTAKSAGKGGEN